MNAHSIELRPITIAVRRTLLMVLLAVVTMGAYAAEEPQRDVRIASDGMNFAAIWQQGGDAHTELVLSRVTRSGMMLDEPAIVLATDPGDFTITYGGSAYLILWTERVSGALKARRMSALGYFLDDQPIVIISPAHAYGVAAVWDGNRFFVVWNASDRGVGGVFGAFLDANGVLSEARQLSPAVTYFEGSRPRVAWNGRRFLVSWSSFIMCEPACYYGPYGVWLVRVSAEGTPLESKVPFLLPDAARIRIESDGANFLGIYDEIGGGISTFTVLTDGEQLQLSAPRRIFSWFGLSASDLTWDGVSFVAASRYNNLVEFQLPPQHRQSWLSLTRLATDGMVIARSVMSSSELGEGVPQIANAAGETLIAIPEVTAEGVYRIRIHLLAEMHASPAPPDPPAGLMAVMSATSTRLTWTSEGLNAEGYVIEQSFPGSLDATQILVVDSSSHSADLRPPQRGWFRVRAFNAGGWSQPSSLVPVLVGRQRAAGRR